MCKEEDNSTAYTKVINSESASYRPILTDTLVLDAVPTVNSFNSVTSDAVARAIAGASGEVPVVTENDNGKVLKAIYDEGGAAVEWAEQTIPTVDQNYDSTSTNAQSGVAVAQALAALQPIPSGSQTITLSNNAYSVNYGPTLKCAPQTVSGSFVVSSATLDTTSTTYSYAFAYGCGIPLTQDFAAVANSGSSVSISFSESSTGVFTFGADAPYGDLIDGNRPGCWFIYDKSDTTKCILLPGSAVGCILNFGMYCYVDITPSRVITLDFSNVVCFNGATLSDVEAGTWYLGFCSKTSDNSCPTTTANCWGGILSGKYVQFPASTYSGSVPGSLEVSNPVTTPTSADAAKVLTVTDTQGNYGWQPVPQELPPIATHAGEVLKVNAGATGVEWGAAGANYTAGSGIAISEQGAISAVGGTGITVTAESTTTQSFTVHTQDYAYVWMPDTVYHSVDYVSVLDSSLVSDIQNGGVDVTLSHSFYQFCDTSSSTNTYLTDWSNNPNQFKAYAAIVYLGAHGATTPTAYFGNVSSRLVLGEVSAPWIDNNQGFPAIAATTVVSYDFDDVNTTLSTITLSSVLANPSDYCMTVLFLDERINAFDNGDHRACTMVGVTGTGNYTTGTLVVTVPGAINVTNPLPPYDTTTDVGKVLQVQNDGTLAWVTLT